MPKTKWHAVAKGRVPGIYQTWDECKAQTAGFSKAIFKSFKTRDDAQAFMISNGASAPTGSAASSSSNTAGKKRARDVNYDDASQILPPSQRSRDIYRRAFLFWCHFVAPPRLSSSSSHIRAAHRCRHKSSFVNWPQFLAISLVFFLWGHIIIISREWNCLLLRKSYNVATHVELMILMSTWQKLTRPNWL